VASESEDRLESEASELNEMAILGQRETRREFIRQVAGSASPETMPKVAEGAK
jgi:hypothetical protein